VGKLDDATKLLEEALRIRQDKLDEGHESIAETEEWMGNVLREQRDYDRALEFYRQSLNSKREIFGGSHEEVANATYTLAITLDGAGKYEAAIMNFKEVRFGVFCLSVIISLSYPRFLHISALGFTNPKFIVWKRHYSSRYLFMYGQHIS